MLGELNRIWSDQRVNVVISENGRSYHGTNNGAKLLSCYKVDGGLIVEGIRCDFALCNNEEKKIFFIELKGSDLSHAAEQIMKTIEVLGLKVGNVILFGRIICSRVSQPNIKRASMIRLETFIAQKGGDVRVQCNQLHEII